ncbi:MAG: hypothetical protein HY560_01290 [Gemmatimonadetes bacterium]|nr:hypothetical protein [Gemmatimonadota bacterium]
MNKAAISLRDLPPEARRIAAGKLGRNVHTAPRETVVALAGRVVALLGESGHTLPVQRRALAQARRWLR